MRDLLSKVRLRPEQPHTDEMLVKTYNTAMSTTAEEVLGRWMSGRTPPPADGHIQVMKVVDSTGFTIGFNVWLIWGEPRLLGSMQVEIE